MCRRRSGRWQVGLEVELSSPNSYGVSGLSSCLALPSRSFVLPRSRSPPPPWRPAWISGGDLFLQLLCLAKKSHGKRTGEQPGTRCSCRCEHWGTHFSHLRRVGAVRDGGRGWKTCYCRGSSCVRGAGMCRESFALVTSGNCCRDALCQGNSLTRGARCFRCSRAMFARCR